MRIGILTDLEGVAGVNGKGDSPCGNRIEDHDRAGLLLTEEVNACCEGLLDAGADEIIVWDGHGGSNSIHADKLHPAAALCNICYSALTPVAWYDASFDGIIQLGAHAMHGVTGAYLSHSFNSHGITGMELNGTPIGEIGIHLYGASYFHVPTLLLSGDQYACNEAHALLPHLDTVQTRFSLGRYTAISRPIGTVRKELRDRSYAAARKMDRTQMLQLPEHLELLVHRMCPNDADAFEKIGIERVDASTLRFRTDDFTDLRAQLSGWAPGVHQRRYGITPDSRFIMP